MKQNNIFNNYKIYVAFALLLIAMILVNPNIGKFPYEYSGGRPWTYETLITEFDFPILKSQDEIWAEKEQRAAEVIPYYTADNELVKSKFQSFIENRATSDSSELGKTIDDIIIATLEEIYSNGVVSKFEDEYKNSQVIMVQNGKQTREVSIGNVYDANRAIGVIKSELSLVIPANKYDSIINSINLNQYIVPNLILDKKTTDLLHTEAIKYISPTKGIIYEGQTVVNKGETITDDIKQILDSYKSEYENTYGYSGSYTLLKIGQILIFLVILVVLFYSIVFSDLTILEDMRKIFFILLLFFLSFLFTALLNKHNPDYLFALPYTVFALYMMAFFKSKVVFSVYIVMLLPLLIIPDKGLMLFLMNLTAGTITINTFKYFYRGWLQFLNSVFIYISMSIVYIAYTFITEGVFPLLGEYHISIFLSALLVFAAYPFVFLFEKLFGFVSTSKLRDLTDTSNKLLQELSRKAPGTFQHSLQVANLSEAAARKIGANPLLTRVGALYHDIGKMKNPQYFIENQSSGVNLHEGKSPEESAKIILDHVPFGVETAKKYFLPTIVSDFILTHHGKSQTLYFYNKFCNEGGDPSLIDNFTYDGEYPTTKEQVLVMMADAVEAASRSLKDYTSESISELVEKIISTRLNDKQLSKANISIKEINLVKASFKKDLKQVYHNRISYPDRIKIA